MRQPTEKNVTEVTENILQTGKSSLFKKMIDDQKAVSGYFQGKVTIEDIHARGIKLVKPL